MAYFVFISEEKTVLKNFFQSALSVERCGKTTNVRNENSYRMKPFDPHLLFGLEIIDQFGFTSPISTIEKMGNFRFIF